MQGSEIDCSGENNIDREAILNDIFELLSITNSDIKHLEKDISKLSQNWDEVFDYCKQLLSDISWLKKTV